MLIGVVIVWFCLPGYVLEISQVQLHCQIWKTSHSRHPGPLALTPFCDVQWVLVVGLYYRFASLGLDNSWSFSLLWSTGTVRRKHNQNPSRNRGRNSLCEWNSIEPTAKASSWEMIVRNTILSSCISLARVLVYPLPNKFQNISVMQVLAAVLALWPSILTRNFPGHKRDSK